MSENQKPPAVTRLGRKLIVFDGSEPLIVIRPADPELALRLVKDCVETNDPELFAKIVLQEQDYTYRGFLGKNGKILDENGRYLELLKPGDSFVTVKNSDYN